MFYNKWTAVLVIVVYCMSFSSVAYVGIAVSCGLIVLRNRGLLKKVFIFVLGVVLVLALWNKVSGFRERVNDSLNLVSVEKIESGNLSSIVFVSNFRVTLESVKAHWGMGTGLGSYVYEHDKYIDQVYEEGIDYGKTLNREDGNSLVLRTVTECGIWGLIFLIWFVLKYRVSQQNIYADISHAVIVDFLLRGLRQGHYFFGEMFFFVVIYLMCYRCSRKSENECITI
jgi:O-antigen ligase